VQSIKFKVQSAKLKVGRRKPEIRHH